MSQTLHKVFIHGHLMVEFFNLPLGMMSEGEASNKYFKKYRECFTRKCDRRKTNLDLFYRLLCHSILLLLDIVKQAFQKKVPCLQMQLPY